MSKANTRGILLSLLIGAVMAAGILLASNAKASPQEDYEYFTLLENNGLVITNRYKAKSTAYTICNELAAGTGWRTILHGLMDGGDWDLDTAATVFSVAVVVYCPELEPDLDAESNVA